MLKQQDLYYKSSANNFIMGCTKKTITIVPLKKTYKKFDAQP